MSALIALATAVQFAATAGGAHAPRPALLPAPSAGEAVYAQLPGEDRFRHFAASYGATAFAFGAVRAVDRDAALPTALSVAAVLGIAKELHDYRRGGPFDLVDIVANAAGMAAAYLFLREMR